MVAREAVLQAGETGGSVKTTIVVLVLGCSASAVFAGQQATVPVKMECRDLSTSGNVLAPNETLVNGMACHVVGAGAKQNVQTASAPAKSAARGKARR